MKNIIFSVLIGFLIVSCKPESSRYTQDSPEIDHYKSLVTAYEAGDWESFQAHFADTAKIYHNSDDLAATPKEISEGHIETLNLFSEYGFEKDKGDMEMVTTDKGETWVNFWGVWKGTMAETNNELSIPVHVTAQFIDGKIVKEYGYWDRSALMLALEEMSDEEDVMDEDDDTSDD